VPVSQATGSQTCVIGTEHFLTNPNVAGVFHLELDLSAMAAGDVLEVRVYKIIVTAGTSRVCLTPMVFSGAQVEGDVHSFTIPVSNVLTDTNSVRFSIKQTVGTGRAIPWHVHRQ
jgi:hypothetical protein